jgi:hypothetical protein
MLALSVMFLLLGGFGLGYWQVSKMQAKNIELRKQKIDLEKQVKDRDIDKKRIDIFTNWDEHRVNWLDEMYEVTAKFPDVKSSRIDILRAEQKDPGKDTSNKTVGNIYMKMATEKNDFASIFKANLDSTPGYMGITLSSKGTTTGGVRSSGTSWLTYDVNIAVKRRAPNEYMARLDAKDPGKPSKVDNTAEPKESTRPGGSFFGAMGAGGGAGFFGQGGGAMGMGGIPGAGQSGGAMGMFGQGGGGSMRGNSGFRGGPKQ